MGGTTVYNKLCVCVVLMSNLLSCVKSQSLLTFGEAPRRGGDLGYQFIYKALLLGKLGIPGTQMPLAQNCTYSTVAYFGVAYPDVLQ